MKVNQSTYYRFYRQVFNALEKMIPSIDSDYVKENKRHKKNGGILKVSKGVVVNEHFRYHAALPKSFKSTKQGEELPSTNTSKDKKIESLKDLDRETISLVEHQYGAYIDEKYMEKFKQVCSEIEDYDANPMKNLVKEVVFDIYNTITKG